MRHAIKTLNEGFILSIIL